MTSTASGSQRFDIWAPDVSAITLVADGSEYPMSQRGGGWWTASAAPAGGEVDYGYLPGTDTTPLPDPRSRRQPAGVHSLSRTFDPSTHDWADGEWRGRELQGAVIYELHLGTFTPEGTLEAAAGKLGYLKDLGVDFVELLPVNGFNGTHNWGYDGVLWYTVHEGYGGPAAYQRFVDAAHRAGLGVIQDVVYNHLGPSGNYLPRFGPYLKSGEGNTWGDSVNLDGHGSDEVRRYILDNAAMWLRDYHVDGLRIDAVHAFKDERAVHLLEDFGALGDAVAAETGRPITMIAESDLNNPRLLYPRDVNGYGLEGQWSDDFHHAVHVNISGETAGYYSDFNSLGALAKVLRDGFFHDGSYSSFRGPAPRTAHQHRAGAPGRAGGLQPEPRPDRQPRHRRQAVPVAVLRAAGPGRCPHADVPVHPHALYGGGVRCHHALAVLHLPPGARAGQGDGGRPHQGVRAHGVGSRRRARSAGPGNLPAFKTELGRGRGGPPCPPPGALPLA